MKYIFLICLLLLASCKHGVCMHTHKSMCDKDGEDGFVIGLMLGDFTTAVVGSMVLSKEEPCDVCDAWKEVEE